MKYMVYSAYSQLFSAVQKGVYGTGLQHPLRPVQPWPTGFSLDIDLCMCKLRCSRELTWKISHLLPIYWEANSCSHKVSQSIPFTNATCLNIRSMHCTQADYGDTSHQCNKWMQRLGATVGNDLPSFNNVAVTSQKPVDPSRSQR